MSAHHLHVGPAGLAPIIKAVTFDLDGTLYSIRRMVWRNWLTMLPIMDFFRDLHRVRDGLRGQGPFEDFRAEQARRLAEVRRIPTQQAVHLVEQVIDGRWMSVFSRVRLYPGARKALSDLNHRGLGLGIVSDYPAHPKLQGLGLSDFPFAAVVDAEQVGALKPHPAPFLRAAETMGLEPAEILHVGDREDCDVQGALGAGMRAVLFGRKTSAKTTRAEFAFSDWRRFMALLEERGLFDTG